MDKAHAHENGETWACRRMRFCLDFSGQEVRKSLVDELHREVPFVAGIGDREGLDHYSALV